MWHVESTEACSYTWSGHDADQDFGHGDGYDDDGHDADNDDGDDADNDDKDGNGEAFSAHMHTYNTHARTKTAALEQSQAQSTLLIKKLNCSCKGSYTPLIQIRVNQGSRHLLYTFMAQH